MNIEDIYRDAFSDSAAMPPGDIWGNIEQKLNDDAVENLFKEKFENDREKPPSGMWFKISQRMWLSEFVKFNPSKFNVYYAAVILMASLGLYLGSDDESEIIAENSVAIQEQIVEQTKPVQTKVVTSENEVVEFTQTTTENATVAYEAKPEIVETQVETVEATKATVQPSQPVKTEIIPVVNFDNLAIDGKDSPCQWSAWVYTATGIDEGVTLDWNVGDMGTVKVIAPNKAYVEWTKEGNASIQLIATKEGSSKSVSKSINVVAMKKSDIIGKAEVCQGDQDITYRVDNSQDLNKIYLWESTKNPVTVISNGYISIDWEKSGVDTIELTDINTASNCKLTVKLPVLVHPQPKGKIDIKRVSGTEYTFLFKPSVPINMESLKYEWLINYEKYNDGQVDYTFTESGMSAAELKVTDENACTFQTRETVLINRYALYVPDAFAPRSRDANEFIPTGADLIDFKMEIFNSANQKLWETTELSSGIPSEGWDGTMNGVVQPKGVYIWKISAVFEDGTEWPGILLNGEYVKVGKFYLIEK